MEIQKKECSIEVRGLGKKYEIFSSPRDRFWQSISGGRWKRSSDFWALKDVTFKVWRGETFGIVGRNGAGKSTLLQIICGVLQASEGDLAVRGRITALLELGAGLNAEFDGIDNIRMMASILGIDRSTVDQKLPEIIEFAQLGDFINRPVKLYSSGMATRLAFSAAINFDPDILVVDEALSVGDEFFQLKCMRRIDEIKKRGATILFVSHSMGTVNQICDRAALIDAGRLQLVGPAKTVTERYNKLLFSLPHVEPSASPAASSRERYLPQDVIELRQNPASIHVEQCGRIEAVGVQGLNHSDLTIDSGQEMTFVAKVSFSRSVSDVIMGMMITTPTGVDCYHTNLLCRGEPIPTCMAGEVYLVRFTMPIQLGPGSYVVVFDCQYDLRGTPKLVDIFYEALQFRVAPKSLVEDGGIASLGARIQCDRVVG